ncbi:hypothetical protein UPYG_G00203930 [Umbra pygmaea]|uniref:B box-type domain-containing protein n=1 Tax=Umbra pygmaea TaxID=75934 RepID=A0ABD0WJQ5_UMBPY
MNLNDFVVIPNKPKSVKLNARNLRELRMETVVLAQESKDMEDRLRQLRESMSREKDERERSGAFRWKSGQAGALNHHSAKRNKENGLQKLSAGKLKVRVLQDECQSVRADVRGVLDKDKAPPLLLSAQVTSRKPRLRGKVCGQCEARTAGLLCAECGEDYCVSCFAKFHQKGALKLHRMIPIQAEIQTSVSSLDVVSHFQRQVHPNPDYQTAEKGALRGLEGRNRATHVTLQSRHAQGSQGSVVNQASEDVEENEKASDDELQKEEEEEVEMATHSLLTGEYDEEESARSFREALRQWRGERREGEDSEQIGAREDTIWGPRTSPRPVNVMGTQAGLSDTGVERGPVNVEFTQHSLTYLDRLLLKKHRRTPIEAYQPLASRQSSLKHNSPPEETTNALTVEDEEFRQYCASLFAVSSCGGNADPEPSPGLCASIEELDETVKERGFVAEPKAEDDSKQKEVHVIGGLKLSNNAVGWEAVSPRPPLLSKTKGAELPKTDQTSIRSSRSINETPQLPGPKTARTPRRRTKTPVDSPQPDHSFSLRLSTPDPSPPRNFTSTHDPDHSSAGPSSSTSPSPPSSHSLRSTFTLSSSISTRTESHPVPKGLPASLYYDSASFAKSFSDRSSPETFLPSPSGSTSTGSQSPSQHLPTLLDKTMSPPEHLSTMSPEIPVSSRSPPKVFSAMSTSAPSPAEALASPSPEILHARSFKLQRTGYKSTPLPQDSTSSQSLPYPLPLGQSCPTPLSSRYVSAPKLEELVAQIPASSPSPILLSLTNDPLTLTKSPRIPITDFDTESSSDSLGLTPHEEDSSDEEMKMDGCIQDWRCKAEEREGQRVLSDAPPYFLTAQGPEEETGDLVPKPSLALRVVAQKEQPQVGSYGGLDGFLTLGLVELDSSQPSSPSTDTPLDKEDSRNTMTTGANSWRLSSNLRGCAEQHLATTGTVEIQIPPISSHSHVDTPTWKRASSERQLHISGFTGLSGRSTPMLPSSAASAVSGPASFPVSRPLSRAAQEILDISRLDKTGCEDPDLEHDIDTRALSSLVEEFRLIETDSGQPWVPSTHGGEAGIEGRVNREGSSRLVTSHVHSDDEGEEDIWRDQQSVLSLP